MVVFKIKIPGGWTPDEFRGVVARISGVTRVDVNREKMLARIAAERQIQSHELPRERKMAMAAVAAMRPSFLQLIGLFALVLIIGQIASRFGLLKGTAAVGSSVSVAAALVLGLVAGTSSCIAVSGGLMLSAIAARRAKMRTVLLFVGGRTLSYGVFGAVIGGIGAALTPSPAVVGFITIIAALYMFKVGLDMLELTPRWLLKILPAMPLALGRKVMDQEESKHPFAPALLGAGTFFLPCGFTQALQLYALTTGSALQSASVLLAFALGTAPALLALGWASNSLKGKAGTFFFRFSGALVIVLGLWNVQNGMTVAGYPLRLPRLTLGQTREASAAVPGGVIFDGTTQKVAINVSNVGYAPDSFTLKEGVPTKFLLSGPAAGQGCLSGFTIPQLGIRKRLIAGETTEISFTAPAPGRYSFSCSMGMVRGEFTVI